MFLSHSNFSERVLVFPLHFPCCGFDPVIIILRSITLLLSSWYAFTSFERRFSHIILLVLHEYYAADLVSKEANSSATVSECASAQIGSDPLESYL